MSLDEVKKEIEKIAKQIVISIANAPSNKQDEQAGKLIQTMLDVYIIGKNDGYEQGIENTRKPKSLLGLPCTKCHTYNTTSGPCPVCNKPNS